MKTFEEFIAHYDIWDYDKIPFNQVKRIAVDYARYVLEYAREELLKG